MGMVIEFPEQELRLHGVTFLSEPAQVIILPVIRIERHLDGTSGGPAPRSGSSPGRTRRGRS